MTYRTLIVALLATVALPALPAMAQLTAGGSGGGIRSPIAGKAPGKEPTVQAPPALPGARAEPTTVAPADKSAADLPPTEALFDAINRGDLATAKDAVNRGADLAGKNVLGLTPLELAIDLGRNQISFLLLSLRGSNGFTTTSAPGEKPKPPSRAELLATQKAERAERAGRERNARAIPAQSAGPQTARLFAGNGGAPIPQAGFLGFDATR